MANNKQKNKKNTYAGKNSYANKNQKKKMAKFDFTYKDYTDRVDISGQNRWSATVGMLNGNFLKLIMINVLLLLFFLPTIALFFKAHIDVLNFSSFFKYNNAGLGSYYPVTLGQVETLQFVQNKYAYLGLVIFAFLGAFAFAGGFYFLRNFIWTNGNFNAKDLLKGVKNSYLKILFYTIILMVVYVVCLYSISLSNVYYATNGGWYFIFAKICAITLMCIFALIYLYCCSLTVTFKIPLFKTIAVAFKYSFHFFLPNVFFMVICIIPFLIIPFTGLEGFGSIITMIIVFLGLIYAFLVWSSYTQYAFDKTVNAKIDTTVKVKEPKVKKEKASKRETEFIKPVTDDVEIEQLPEMFSRKDIEKLEESKKHMREDSDKYYTEKKNKKSDGESDE